MTFLRLAIKLIFALDHIQQILMSSLDVLLLHCPVQSPSEEALRHLRDLKFQTSVRHDPPRPHTHTHPTHTLPKLSAQVLATPALDLWPPGKPCYSIWHHSFSHTATPAVYLELLTVAFVAHLLPSRVVQGWTSNLMLIRTYWWCSLSQRTPQALSVCSVSHPSFFSNVWLTINLAALHIVIHITTQFPPSKWHIIQHKLSCQKFFFFHTTIQHNCKD